MRDILEDALEAQAKNEEGAFDPVKQARKASKRDLPKRFYKDVTVDETEAGFSVLLDGRPIKTPARAQVAVPARALAEALAEEWAAQGKEIDPATMPMTRLVNSALDGVARDPEPVREEFVRFSGSDLLCYRADSPQELVTRQTEAWDPILAWANEHFQIRLHIMQGLMPVEQPEESLAAMARVVGDVDPLSLAALHSMTTLLGSALLGLAVFKGRLSADEAWRAAHIDEDWNIELWGEDFEAQDRRAYRYEDMKVAANMAAFLGA